MKTLEKLKEEQFRNKLSKCYFTECLNEDDSIDWEKVDGSNDFSIIPTNSKGIVQINIGNLRDIVNDVFQAGQKDIKRKVIEWAEKNITREHEAIPAKSGTPPEGKEYEWGFIRGEHWIKIKLKQFLDR